ncbi:MAG TPA: PTS sugar transporter subunit IIA [Planctomycetota bacterium]|nr:PTS sugar transporter subunit IIA [Planctomycetota bacterium]
MATELQGVRMTISLEAIIPPERVILLDATTKEEALRRLAAVVATSPDVTDGTKLLAAIHEREKIMSTGIGLGIAIPHAKIPSVRDFVVGFAKIDQGIDFNSLDGKPVHFIVMIAGPDHQQERYLQLLARITLKLKDAAVRRRLAEAGTVDEILAALR